MVPVAALEPCEAQGRRPRNAFTPLVMESDDSDCESDASGSSAASYGSSCRMMDTAPADTVEDLRNATLWPFTGFTIVQAPPEAPFLEASPEEFRYEAYKERQATGSCTEYFVTELRMRAQALRLRSDIAQFLSDHEARQEAPKPLSSRVMEQLKVLDVGTSEPTLNPFLKELCRPIEVLTLAPPVPPTPASTAPAETASQPMEITKEKPKTPPKDVFFDASTIFQCLSNESTPTASLVGSPRSSADSAEAEKNTFKLFCVIVGSGTVFPVDVDVRECVSTLKEAIAKKKRREIQCDPDELALYAAKQPGGSAWLATDDQRYTKDLTRLKAGMVTDRMRSLMRHELDATFDICDYFNDGTPKRRVIHVLVKLPSSSSSAGRATERKRIRSRKQRFNVVLAKDNQSSRK